MKQIAKQILNYWRSLECLNPKEIPSCDKTLEEVGIKGDNHNIKVNKKISPKGFDSSNRVTYACFELGHKFKNPKFSDEFQKLKWEDTNIVVDEEYYILLSIINSGDVIERFIDAFGIEEAEKRKSTETICASFRVDKDCLYIDGSLEISPFVWVIKQLVEQNNVSLGDIKLDGWETLVKDIERELDIPNKKISAEYAVDFISSYLNEYLLRPINVVPRRVGYAFCYIGFDQEDINQVKTDNMPISQIYSSFYLKDIELVTNHIDTLSDSHPLVNYIVSLINETKQYNLLSDIEVLKNWYSSETLPLGRWPSKFNLSFMQQVAVNIAKENPKKVFSVNGPPGTGKTTLLKDIIANNIVERAYKLCAYESTEEIFTEHLGRDGKSKYYIIPEDIIQYAMLVLSSNNKAVENITLELPHIDSVAEGSNNSNLFQVKESDLEIDVNELQKLLSGKKQKTNNNGYINPKELYFTFLANQLGEEQWGLISARLGKKVNIDEFGKILSLLRKDLKPVLSIESENTFFKEKKEKFLGQYKLVKALLSLFADYENNKKQIEVFCKCIAKYKERLATLELELKQFEGIENKKDSVINEKQKLESILIELNSKRSFVDKLWMATNWPLLKSLSNDTLLSVINEKKQLLQEVAKSLQGIEDKLREKDILILDCQNLEKNIKKSDSNIVDMYVKQEDIKKQLHLDKEQDIQIFDDIESYIGNSIGEEYKNWHIAALYVTTYINECREELLYDALQLQKAIVLSKPFRHNMNILFKYWSSTGSRHELSGAFDLSVVFPAVFNTLFIAVPVISSTFAAIERFLKDCQEEGSLGTIIVDEAGQASPHMVIGSLFRAKQAIIVGDPKQIEPVQTAADLFMKYLGDESINRYRDKTLSVQSLADAQNPYAGIIQNQDGSESWVGCPLVVHRRCLEPMFTISNELSYGGFMINQTFNPKEPVERFSESCWITYDDKGISTTSKKNYFIDKQGDIGCRIIESFINRGVDISKIFVITPFTSVVFGFQNYFKKEFENSEQYSAWLKNNIGTVHTFQGKEAAVVIYMLGCQSDGTADGAIRWVNANNVNVAFTRAKECIYVIGDAKRWTLNKNLDFVQQHIPVYNDMEYLIE